MAGTRNGQKPSSRTILSVVIKWFLCDFEGFENAIEKNRLHKPPPVVGIDAIHEVLDYDS